MSPLSGLLPKLLRRTAAQAPDEGTSLAELVIAMSLTLILAAMITATFLSGTNAVWAADARGADTQQAKIAAENLSKQLRQAVDPDGTGPMNAFVAATPYDVTFYVATHGTNGVPTTPNKVRIWLDGTVLRQQVNLPTSSTSWASTGTVRVVGVNVLSGARPLLTYLTSSDTATDSRGVTVTSLPNSGGTVSGATLASIEAVEIWVSINSNPAHRSTATTAVTRVTLLNR